MKSSTPHDREKVLNYHDYTSEEVEDSSSSSISSGDNSYSSSNDSSSQEGSDVLSSSSQEDSSGGESKLKKARKKQNRVEKNADIIHYLCRASPRVRSKIVACLPRDVLDAFSETAINIYAGNVPMTSYQRKKLNAKRGKLEALCQKSSVSCKQKKEILGQKGGLLPLLLPLLAPLVTNLVSKVVG